MDNSKDRMIELAEKVFLILLADDLRKDLPMRKSSHELISLALSFAERFYSRAQEKFTGE